MKSLSEIVAPQQEISPALLMDWERQFRTAEAISSRFEDGYRTQLLADEVGMGKTYVAMAVMSHHIFQTLENDRKVLLVVPNSTILSRKWGQELSSFYEQYVKHAKGGGGKKLRPLHVDGYWDLIENLHDYENQEVPVISETMAKCIALFFYSWWKSARRRKGAWLRDWPDVGNMEEGSPSLLDFASRFSRRAFHEFLDARTLTDPIAMDQLVRALESGESRREDLKALFREFARNQDSHESNVYVMTMKALGKSRRNNPSSRLLNTWMTSRILVGRRTATRERILSLLDDSNLVTRDGEVSGNYLDWFNSLAAIDLWGMSRVLEEVIEAQGGKASLFDGFREETCVKLLGLLHDQVIRAKLTEAGIGLAVVDEAHNWKNGSNGATDFANAYAPYIRNKLLLSATPFQLDQDELGRIFKLTRGGDELFGEDKSYGTVQAVLDQGLASECLRESDAFQTAWQGLSMADVEELTELSNQAEKVPGTDILLSISGSPSLEPFLARFQSYAMAVGRLQGELSKVMLRHVKDRTHRHFHAGKDWLGEGMPIESGHTRSGLYLVDGFADPRHALLGYLGMRLVQKLSRGKGTGNARLLRGITSSFAAFKASNQDTLEATQLTGDVRAYLNFFGEALEKSSHPKVAATADRAFANYRRGSKTLIFCERVPTLEEIEKILIGKVATLFPDGIPEAQKRRKALLRNQTFVDLHWSRSLLQMLPKARRTEIETAWNRDHASLVEGILKKLMQSGEVASERRIGRMVDLELMARMDPRELPAWAGIFHSPSSDSRSLFVEGALPDEADSSGGAIDPDEEIVESLLDEDRKMVEEGVKGFLNRENLWFHAGNVEFHQALHGILASEYEFLEKQDNKRGEETRAVSFYGMLVDLVQGMRKILLLRPEHFAVRDMDADDLEARLLADLWEVPGTQGGDAKDSKPTPGARLGDFLRILTASEGTIQRRWKQDSKRKSLWSGVFIRYNETAGLVMTLDGSVPADTRVSRCAAFNSPLAPDILICTAIGAEGIDLHRYCSEVIHHDLPWNPAKLEQRIGRIDRVGSLTERSSGRLLIGIPFLANDYETIQYQVLQSRAQRFEVLLGKPDFSLDVEEEDQEDKVKETREEDEVAGEVGGVLPKAFLERLRMDLRVVA